MEPNTPQQANNQTEQSPTATVSQPPQQSATGSRRFLLLFIGGIIGLIILWFLINITRNVLSPSPIPRQEEVHEQVYPTNVVEEDSLEREVNDIHVPSDTTELDAAQRDIDSL